MCKILAIKLIRLIAIKQYIKPTKPNPHKSPTTNKNILPPPPQNDKISHLPRDVASFLFYGKKVRLGFLFSFKKKNKTTTSAYPFSLTHLGDWAD